MRTRDDVDRVRRVIEERCQAIGSKVALVVNYDEFLIDAAVADTYAAMVRYLETHYYTTASRYTTSAFLRLKLGEALVAAQREAAHLRDAGRGAGLRPGRRPGRNERRRLTRRCGTARILQRDADSLPMAGVSYSSLRTAAAWEIRKVSAYHPYPGKCPPQTLN